MKWLLASFMPRSSFKIISAASRKRKSRWIGKMQAKRVSSIRLLCRLDCGHCMTPARSWREPYQEIWTKWWNTIQSPCTGYNLPILKAIRDDIQQQFMSFQRNHSLFGTVWSSMRNRSHAPSSRQRPNESSPLKVDYSTLFLFAWTNWSD